MALERFDTFPSPCWRSNHASAVGQLPHFDRLIKTSTDERSTIGCEGYRIDAVFVAFGAVESLDK